MDRDSLTAAYLDEVDRLGPAALDMPAVARESFDLSMTSYVGRCLTRPVFVDAAGKAQLNTDLMSLYGALSALPDRLFEGDLGAFARAAGMTDAQVTAIQRGAAQAPTHMGRADLYLEGDMFRLMEMNMGSALGGLDNAMMNRAVLKHPAFAAFAEAQRLAYVDTMAEVAYTVLTESKVPSGHRPLMAATDWPASFANLEGRLRYTAIELDRHGIDAVACHVGQLRCAGGRVWLEDRPVDVIYRLFMIEDLLDPAGPELVDPVLRAAERGEVAIFAPMHAELFGSKSALAMLSDEHHRHLLTPAERASLDRLLPWTRMVRPGLVTVDNETVELAEYAVAAQQDLVLKPTMLHGGTGVVPGWEVSAPAWKERLAAAMGGTFVLQRRIRAAAEPFPVPGGGQQEWLLTWGAFLGARGYAGMFIRGIADGAGGVVNTGTGATGTCCFHVGA
jgi:hypothetical protein